MCTHLCNYLLIKTEVDILALLFPPLSLELSLDTDVIHTEEQMQDQQEKSNFWLLLYWLNEHFLFSSGGFLCLGICFCLFGQISTL